MKARDTDLIVDGNSLYAKCFYATLTSEELKATRDGHLFAMWKSFFYAIKSDIGVPECVLFCFDGRSKTNKPRKPKPRGYETELSRLMKDVIPDAFGKDAWALHPDHESDDLVATAAHQAKNAGRQVVIMSGDKDLTQLVEKNVTYYCLNKKRTLTTREICDKWGVHRPSQVAVALALLGDSGDGINGVARYGPKAVSKAFAQINEDADLAQTIDKVYPLLNEEQQGQFLESLHYTLLDREIPGNYRAVKFDPNPDFDVGDFAQIASLMDPDAAVEDAQRWEP